MISLKDYICEALKPGNHAIAEYELENVSSNIKYNDQIDKYLCGMFGLNKSKFEVNVTGNVEDLDGTIEVTKKDDNQKIKIYFK